MQNLEKNPDKTGKPDFFYPDFGLNDLFFPVFWLGSIEKHVKMNYRQKNFGLIMQKTLLPVTSGLDFGTGLRALPVGIWA